MGKIIRRILTIIPAVALQSLWLLLLMKWLTPYAPMDRKRNWFSGRIGGS